MLLAAVGSQVATELGFAPTWAGEPAASLTFGEIEPLVCLMQETPVTQLLPVLAERLRGGTELRDLVRAAALANARTFGGDDYVGFHTMMALSPALHMAGEMPSTQSALPVFKVLYRNTNRIQEFGGRTKEVLHPTEAGETQCSGEKLRTEVRNRNTAKAEQLLAAAAQRSADEAFNDLLFAVHDATEVHRVVMPYRAWDLLGLIGKEHAATLLRQSIHYCVRTEVPANASASVGPRRVLPRLLEEYKLLERAPGDRKPDDAWIEQFSQTLFQSSAEQAATAAAAALAEGFSPDAIGEAITLTANQLVLRDYGRTPREEVAGKPIGSVHGDSIGVHACDSANAWRNMARVANTRNQIASLILGAYQVAMDRTQRGGDFLNWQPLPHQRYVGEVKTTDAETLLREMEEAIRGNLQARTTALVQRYGDLGHTPRPVFDLMLKYAVSEDGALHAEKFYRTVSEEFAQTRAVFRWRHLVALGRVTASEYGRPAPGLAEARALLRV
jgi:hypothetical protein